MYKYKNNNGTTSDDDINEIKELITKAIKEPIPLVTTPGGITAGTEKALLVTKHQLFINTYCLGDLDKDKVIVYTLGKNECSK